MTDTSIASVGSAPGGDAPRQRPLHTGVRVLTGVPDIRRAAEQLLGESRREQLLSLPVGCEFERSPRWQLHVESALDRNVTTRRLASLGTVTAEALHELRSLTDRGMSTRVMARLPTPFMVTDRRLALVYLPHQEAAGRAAVLNDPVLVAVLTDLFDRHWEAASVLPDGDLSAATTLSARQREIADLLACGHTDESVARRLGVSVRTVRAEVAALRDTLGADSRFQAGVRYASVQSDS